MAYDEDRGVTVFFGGELSNPGDDPTYYNDTWEYDGTRWRHVDIAGEVPLARSGHAMAYDPIRKQVLMQGGVNDEGYLREFWAFEPLGSGAGRWNRLPMFVEGGSPGPSASGDSDEARAGHTLTFDRTHGQVLLVGGTAGPDLNLESPGTFRSSVVWAWNGQHWTRNGEIRQPIRGRWDGPTRHAAAFDSSQGLLGISGGAYYYYGDVQNPGGWVDLTDSRFLLATTFTGIATFVPFRYGFEVAPFPAGRQQHAMVYDEHRRRFVIYGGTGENAPPIGEDHIEAWAVTSPGGDLAYAHDSFALTPRPASRARHAMVYDHRRRVTVLVGGVGGRRYDDTWELGPNPPSIVGQPVGFTNGPCQDASFRVGARGSGTLRYQWRRDGVPLSDGPRHQGVTTEWLRLTGIRHGDAGGYDVVVTDDCGPDLAVVSRVAPLVVQPGLQWVRREIAGPPPRADAAMAFDEARGVMVLFGGYTFENGAWRQLNDLWEYDGAGWHLRHDSLPDNGLAWDPQAGAQHVNSPAPGTRYRHRMAYLPPLGAVALFGGRFLTSAVDAQQLGDLWLWDGRRWTPVPTIQGADAPSPRERHSMAWDPDRGRLAVFGGFPGGPRPDVVWEWNLSSWTAAPFSGVQNTSVSHDGASMVWDGFANRILSGPHISGIGGRAAAFFYWDGTRWTPGPDAVTASAPGAATSVAVPDYGAMAFDRDRRRTVYFGGYYAGLSGTTFQLEPYGWVVADADTGPSPRVGHCMAYDTRRGVMVLFGGATDLSVTVSGETWEWAAVDLPHFDRHPDGATVEPGSGVSLSARAIGAGQVEYQWFRNGFPLQEDQRIGGTRSAMLSIADVRISDAGVYMVRASNACGSRDSLGATVSVAGALVPLATRLDPLGVSLEWSQPGAILEESASAAGPWRPVPAARSPYRPAFLLDAVFFRLRQVSP